MVWPRRRILGLAMEDGAVVAAEIQVSGQKAELLRTAEFAVPDGMSASEPQPMGRALRDFLREHNFSTKTAVIGVPARWLLAAEKVFPPASPEALAGMARLEAERTFVTDVEDLLVDYADGVDSEKGPRLLLIAIERQKVDQLRAMAESAGLKPKAIVPTSLAFAATLPPAHSSGVLLMLRPDRAEIVVHAGGRFRTIRYLPLPSLAAERAAGTVSAEWTRALSHEVLRLAALMPQDQSEDSLGSVALCNGGELAPDTVRQIAESLGTSTASSVHLADLPGVVKTDTDHAGNMDRFAGAVALAVVAGRRVTFPVNFLDSRLQLHGTGRYGRRLTWAVAGAAVVLVAAAAYLIDWRQKEAQLAELNDSLATMKSGIETTASIVERIAQARGWTDRRPQFLEPLRELSLTFPTDARIWVTSFAMRQDPHVGVKGKVAEQKTVGALLDHVRSVTNLAVQQNMHVVISGKAADERTVLDLLDRVRRSAAFDQVKLVYMRDAGTNSTEVGFSMTFDFVKKG